MAFSQHVIRNQWALHCQTFTHAPGANTLDSNPPPRNPPELLPPPSNSPQVMPGPFIPPPTNPQTSHTLPINPPTFTHGPWAVPPYYTPTRLNPPTFNPPILHQLPFNPLSGITHQAVNRTSLHGQQMQPQPQPQPLIQPNLNHPPILHFTFVLEYMGARIVVKTDRPTRFQILYLCNFAASALRNAYSPRNHIFRPTVAPPWLGRVIRVQSDGLLRGVVQQCISRGECALQIWVNFIPYDRVEHPSSSIFNSGPANVPVVVDLGAVPPPHAVQSVHPPVPIVLDPQQPQPPPILLPNSVNSQQPTPEPPSVSNPVDAQVGHNAASSPTQNIGVTIATQTPSLATATPLHNGGSAVHNVGPTPSNVVTTVVPPQPANERRKYKCQNCGRVGHSKRTCKLANPILSKVSATVCLKASEPVGRAGPSGAADVLAGMNQSNQTE